LSVAARTSAFQAACSNAPNSTTAMSSACKASALVAAGDLPGTPPAYTS
jgi:hypothetical protein